MFVQPIVTVLIYFMSFQLGFKSVPPIPGVPYVLWLVPGIVPWFFFQEAMNAGTNCLQEYHYLVKKVVFNVEVLPVIKLVSCLLVHAIFVMIMIAMFFCYGRLSAHHLAAARLLQRGALGLDSRAHAGHIGGAGLFPGHVADCEYLSPVRHVAGSHHVGARDVPELPAEAPADTEIKSHSLHCERLPGQHDSRELVL